MAWLTKSRFLAGLQCRKRLWFEVHQPLEAEVAASTAMRQGRQFDEVVRQLRPGVVIARDQGMPAAIAETKKVLGNARSAPAVLHQPAFRAGDLAVIADVLQRSGAAFDLVEVKASTHVKETHLADAAFQALVLQRAKIPVGRVFIGHVDNQFVLRRMGEYEGLLAEADITGDVQRLLPEVAGRAVEFLAVMADGSTPEVTVGPQCTDPYECPFIGRCTAGTTPPEYPVELLPRGGKVVAQLLAGGFTDLRDVPAKRLTNALHRRVFDATTSGLPFFDQAAVAELRALPYPFAYLDFETWGSAVPEVVGTRPYEQVPFQWSVHVEHSPSVVRHAEYLGVENFGDFAAMAAPLVAALPSSGPVFAYNASFEERVLLQMAERVPEHGEALRSIAARLVDLLPVTRAAYYHRDMRGSWSIKAVMPTIDPSLGYETLGEVQEGDGAQLAFLELRSAGVGPERAAALRSALLRYCRHDTWVMVVLRRFLCGEGIGR